MTACKRNPPCSGGRFRALSDLSVGLTGQSRLVHCGCVWTHTPAAQGRSRLETRFSGHAETLAKLQGIQGETLGADAALELGLVTVAPDELDWEDELRMAIEERTSLSPDALTGMEASLRFPGPESMESKIFGRLSAWQNWIFIRPNATGEQGALKLFGKGSKPKFDRERV